MRLEKNNNSRIIYRVAGSNLLGSRLYSFFTVLTIFIAVVFVSTLVLFLSGIQTADRRIISGMQHVMFMNTEEAQMKKIAQDPRTEIVLPYKFNDREYGRDGVEYCFYYFESNSEGLFTYVPAAGRPPQAYDEIVVDKKFMEAMGDNIGLGSVVSLDLGGLTQKFTVCGYTDKKYTVSTHPVYVSRSFAETSNVMGTIPYTALVRIKGAQDMNMTEFETIVYQMAADYGIRRADINMNGKFEEYLRTGNTNLYTLLAVSLLILAASAIVIYSIFYLSVASRVQQIGQLQTIGMTQKQVKKMIRHEGLILSALAVPPGLLVSCAAARFLQPDGWSLENTAAIVLIVGVMEFFIVQFSIGKPVSVAAKVSPIEASKCVDSEKPGSKDMGKHKRLTAFRLAWMEAGKGGKKWWITTSSLALGGIVFMAAVSTMASWDEDNFSRQGMFADAEFDISYLYDAHSNPQPYGPSELQREGHLNQELKDKLLKIPYVKKIEEIESVYAIVDYQGASFGETFAPLSEDSGEIFASITQGGGSYDYLTENDGVLITDKGLTEQLSGVSFIPGEMLSLRWFDGKEHRAQLEIAGVGTKLVSNKIDSTFFISDSTMRKLWQGMNTVSSFRISIEDYERNAAQAEQKIRDVINSFPDLKLYTLREEKINNSAAIKQLNMQIYGITSLVIMFSLFNLINTIISSISTRKKELSMLESIGMEVRQIRRMLFWESLFLILPNLLITLTAGTAAGFGIVAFMDSMVNYMDYRFPLLPCILYIAGMTTVPVLISFLCLQGQGRTALVERIKTEG